jgi:hypothetical protein
MGKVGFRLWCIPGFNKGRHHRPPGSPLKRAALEG